MTERHAGYLVVLDSDIREDDAREIIAAIKMIRFVASVEPVVSDMHNETIATIRRDTQWITALEAVVRGVPAMPKHGKEPI